MLAINDVMIIRDSNLLLLTDSPIDAPDAWIASNYRNWPVVLAASLDTFKAGKFWRKDMCESVLHMAHYNAVATLIYELYMSRTLAIAVSFRVMSLVSTLSTVS